MPKIRLSLLSILFLLLLSCSNDSNNLSENPEATANPELLARSKSDFEKLKDDYKNMINSEEYLLYTDALHEFTSRLLIADGDLNFKDENLLKDWLNNNIVGTDFDSYNQAILLYDNAKVAYEAVVVKNIKVLSEIASFTKKQQLELFLLEGGANPHLVGNEDYQVNAGPCHNECINDAVACGRASDENYAAAMTISSGLWASGNIYAAVSVSMIATLNHSSSQKACARTFNSCYRNCKD